MQKLVRFIEKSKGITVFILPALMVLNIIVKSIYLGFSDIQGDEPFSIYHAQMDVPSIIRLLSTGNNPPLFEIILHYWIKIFGISSFSVRVPSLIFSTVSVGILYRIGKEIFNRRIGVYAAIIFIFSTYQIALTHEARVYQLLGMLTCWSMYLFLRIIQSNFHSDHSSVKADHSLVRIIVLSLVNTLLIYAHYFGLFVILVQFLFVMINWEVSRKGWKYFFMGWGVTFVLYVPNILVLLTRFSESAKGTWISKPTGIQDAFNMVRVFSNAPLIAVILIVILVTRCILFFRNKDKYKFSKPESFVGFWFTFVFIFMFVISFWIPMFYGRYLMVCNVGFVLISAISMDRILAHSNLGYIISGAICLLFVITARFSDIEKQPIRAMIERIKSNQTEETVVYFSPDWFDINFILYYDVVGFNDFDNRDIKNNIHKYLRNKHVFPIKKSEEVRPERHSFAKRVIYLDANSEYHNSNNHIKRTLDSNNSLIKSYSYSGNYTIYIYEVGK